MITIKQQQIIKFILLVIMSVIGVSAYILHGGTIIDAAIIYTGFMIVSRFHMVASHKWLAHRYVNPGPLGRAFFLWILVICSLVKPMNYIIGHRLHHKYSDSDSDPHANSLGFWNLLIGNFNLPGPNAFVSVKDIFRQKDIMFVSKYYYSLYFLNLLIFWFINHDIVLLSFLFLNLKILINTTLFNWMTHGGKKVQSPINLPLWTVFILGYWGEHNHKNHHNVYRIVNKL